MADIELLPCPFCVGAARIQSNRDWHRLYADHDDECVFDADDHVLMYPAQPGYLIQIAEVWNRRAALASRPAEVDDRTPRPISTAPHDGTEVLAWSITGKTWHQVYWKTQENGDWLFLDPFPPRWACRWNSDYYQGQNEFSHWLPIPGAPSHTTNKEK